MVKVPSLLHNCSLNCFSVNKVICLQVYIHDSAETRKKKKLDKCMKKNEKTILHLNLLVVLLNTRQQK